MKLWSSFCLAVSLALSAGALRSNAGTTISELPLWQISPGDRTYVTNVASANERCVAYNPKAGRDTILVCSKATTPPTLAVLKGSDGTELLKLNTTGVSGGTFAMSQIGVADDGVVYGVNLSTSATPSVRIYRWPGDEDDSELPAPAFTGDPAEGTGPTSLRWGDTFAVRGSGVNTQLIMGSGAPTPSVCIFTTTDGFTFSPHFISGAIAGNSKGIAFGAGDTFYSKGNSSSTLRRSSFTIPALPATPSATALNNFTVPTQLIPLSVDLVNNRLASIEIFSASVDTVRLYDISTVTAAPVSLDFEELPINNADTNVVGGVAMGGGRLYTCAGNDGIQAWQIEVTLDVVAPTIGSSPLARSAYDRGQTTFSVTALGTPPFTYKWYHDDVEIPLSNTPNYTVKPIGAGSGGAYKCDVTNTAGTATSTPATLTVLPSMNSNALTELWHLEPGSRPYIQADDTQRGLDYHAASGKLYVMSRTPSASIHVLDATNGADLHALDMTGITGGTFIVNMLGVADDGAVYACNLTTDGNGFKIYRWADDNPGTFPQEVYNGNPMGTRVGDSFDVRGAGLTTQIAVGSRTTDQFALLTTPDGVFFASTTYTVTGAPANAFALGISFGAGDTMWGKMSGVGLTYASFDTAAFTAALIHLFPTANFSSTTTAIGVDPTQQFLAGVAIENSDNVRLYAIPQPFPNPSPTTLTLLDQEFFGTDNANLNGTGAVAVAGGKVFALDTFNGVVAYSIQVSPPPLISNVSYNSGTSQITFTLKGEVGKTYMIQKSPDMTSWENDGAETLATAEQSVSRAATGAKIFFRAKQQ